MFELRATRGTRWRRQYDYVTSSGVSGITHADYENKLIIIHIPQNLLVNTERKIEKITTRKILYEIINILFASRVVLYKFIIILSSFRIVGHRNLHNIYIHITRHIVIYILYILLRSTIVLLLHALHTHINIIIICIIIIFYYYVPTFEKYFVVLSPTFFARDIIFYNMILIYYNIIYKLKQIFDQITISDEIPSLSHHITYYIL